MLVGLAKIYFLFLFYIKILIVFLKLKVNTTLAFIINVLLIISVWIISYNFVPDNTMDLGRYEIMVESIRGLPYSLIKEVGPYKQTIITNWYFSIMSRVDNFSLFSAIPTTLSFIIIFISGSWLLKKSQSSYYNYGLYFMLIISAATLLGIISGVRQNFSWMLILIAVNLDFFGKKQNKWLSFLMYIFAIMVHDGAVVILLIRFLMSFMSKLKYSWLVYLIWPLSLGLIQEFNHVLPPFLQGVLEKLQLYVLNDTATNNIRLILIFIMYLVFLNISIYLYKNKDMLYLINEKYLLFFTNTAFFGLVSFFAPHLYSRIFTCLTVLSLPIIIEYSQSKHSVKNITITILMLISALLFTYQDVYISPIF